MRIVVCMADSLERKLRHLDFIQLTITRMAANSFLLKAWTVTIVTALIALAAGGSKHSNYLLIAPIPAIAFWVLDGYYLHQERRYRALYDKVRVLEEDAIDFSLSTAGIGDKSTRWLSSTFSRTLLFFYGGLLVVITSILVAR